MLKPLFSSPWRDLIALFDARAHAAVLGFACLAAITSGVINQPARAQQKTVPLLAASLPPVKQIPLTEKQIQGMIASSKEMRAITDNAPEDIDGLTPKTVALLDAVARKNGLASYDEYKDIDNNMGLVFGGYDTVTRKYLGKAALIKLQVARLRADKKMSIEDKKEALQTLNDDGQLPLPLVEYKGNVALVIKYADKLSAAMRGD